jgi:hypothetical protein
VIENLEDLVLIGSADMSVEAIRNSMNRLVRKYHPVRVVIDSYVDDTLLRLYRTDFYMDSASFDRARKERK